METAPPSTFYFWWNPLVCSAPHLLSTRLVFGCRDPRAQSLLMPSRAYQSCSFISSDRDPSVFTAVAASTCGSWQETEALVRDSSASLMRPLSFHQPALSSCDWRPVQRLWRDPVPGWGGEGTRRGSFDIIGNIVLDAYKCIKRSAFCLSHLYEATVTGAAFIHECIYCGLTEFTEKRKN